MVGCGVEAFGEAVARHGKSKIVNTDQSSEFTSREFIQRLKNCEIGISVDGKGV